MDDMRPSAMLDEAAHELVHVNRYLGGLRAVIPILRGFLKRSGARSLSILDLGSGVADIPAALVKWGAENDVRITVKALEGNQGIAILARRHLDAQLSGKLRDRVAIEVVEIDHATDLGERFDVVVASLFLHHAAPGDEVSFLKMMLRHSRAGIIVNDLHRHAIAYYAIKVIGSLSGASEVFRHDGPLSVRRGFKRQELLQFARAAGVRDPRVHWRWAFRWTLTNLG